MNLYKDALQNHTFLVIDATLASDNPSYFRKNLLERTWKLIMAIDNKIRDEIHDKKNRSLRYFNT